MEGEVVVHVGALVAVAAVHVVVGGFDFVVDDDGRRKVGALVKIQDLRRHRVADLAEDRLVIDTLRSSNYHLIAHNSTTERSPHDKLCIGGWTAPCFGHPINLRWTG